MVHVFVKERHETTIHIFFRKVRLIIIKRIEKYKLSRGVREYTEEEGNLGKSPKGLGYKESVKNREAPSTVISCTDLEETTIHRVQFLAAYSQSQLTLCIIYIVLCAV